MTAREWARKQCSYWTGGRCIAGLRGPCGGGICSFFDRAVLPLAEKLGVDVRQGATGRARIDSEASGAGKRVNTPGERKTAPVCGTGGEA